MSQRQTYIERRRRCHAARFDSMSEASQFASWLGVKEWSVHQANNDFHMEFVNEAGEIVKLNRGDYVNFDESPTIQRSKDFQDEWELEPSHFGGLGGLLPGIPPPNIYGGTING